MPLSCHQLQKNTLIKGVIYDYSPTYDKKTKTWFCKFYYTDYKGEKKQKKKEDSNYNVKLKSLKDIF